MSKPVILTGLRANNDLHIGNYFGALLPLIDMARSKADEYEINLFVPDLHSFTTPIDHSKLYDQTMHNLKLFAAAGLPLDHPNIHIYRQSYVPAHSELTWILNCFSGMGELGRMTQFKSKSRDAKERVLNEGSRLLNALIATSRESISGKNINPPSRAGNYADNAFSRLKRLEGTLRDAGKGNIAAELNELFVLFQEQHIHELEKQIELYKELDDATIGSYAEVGLFDYPVLMAADILLYDATYVPVGDDQTQHLEFTRNIAIRMNSKFGELFTVPKAVKEQHEFFGKDQGLRIKDLADPTKKMSKSDESARGVIFLGDSPDEAAKKIMSATTDSVGVIHDDPQNQPGVANLLQILALASGKELSSVTHDYEGQTSYGDLKKAVAASVGELLADFQAKLEQVNTDELMHKLEQDEKQMNEIANATLYQVQKAVGLRA
jgi:tryptophanyl-tRNA synthetase